MAHLHTAPVLRRIARQRGLTLVELMVALVIGLMVIMAAMSVFSSSSQSARTVDHAGQLRDDARFAADIIQRLAVQTGFEDIGFVTRTYQGTPQTYKAANGQADPTTMQAPISGFSGQKPATGSGSIEITAASGTAFNNSDTLILRYQAANKGNSESDADGSMMLCSGGTLGKTHGHDFEHRTQRAISIFYVDTDDDGEPTLFCRYANKEGGTLEDRVALVKGVESFKVLYGVDNIEPNTAADCNGTSSSCDTEHAKLVPNRYFYANQMTVGTTTPDPATTQTNWRRVRALRIGMVLRAANSSGVADNKTWYPLGEKFADQDNAGSSYQTNDARLRQNYVFTVNVRNCLNQGYQTAGNPGESAGSNVPPCDIVVPRDPNAGSGSGGGTGGGSGVVIG